MALVKNENTIRITKMNFQEKEKKKRSIYIYIYKL